MRILQVFSVSWQAIVFTFITLFLPEPLLIVGIVLSLTGMSLAIASVLKGRSAWTEFSILEMWILFFTLIIPQALTDTIGQYLTITLLQSVMILFAREVSSGCCEFRQQLSSVINGGDESTAMAARLYRSAQTELKRISRAGLLFASCYLLSIAILYVSTSATLALPLIADISLYIVVVSVSLALLLLSRED